MDTISGSGTGHEPDPSDKQLTQIDAHAFAFTDTIFSCPAVSL